MVPSEPVPTSRAPSGGPRSLTDRELDVLGYLPSRLSIREISRRLGLSENTVKTHLQKIYRKFGVCTRNDAILAAAQVDLLSPEVAARLVPLGSEGQSPGRDEVRTKATNVPSGSGRSGEELV
jgi:DNA-binding CsgD family transcriptional regulator